MADWRTRLRVLFDRTLRGGPEPFEESNDFAFAVYGQLRQRVGNLCLSPFGVRVALGMTLAGARGETATQMRKALRVPSSDESLHVALAGIIQRLNAGGGGQSEMAVANSLWGQDGAPVQAGFLDLIARHYGGGMSLVDFRQRAEAARLAINEWVEEKTRQKVRGLIPSHGLGAETRLVLVNAVYFKGMWVRQFPKTNTRDEPFCLEGGGTVQVPLMYQEASVRYLQADGYQAVDLAYEGGELSLLVLLPDPEVRLHDLEKMLSARMLHDCVAQMSVRQVQLLLPRFKVTWGPVDLSDPLRTLGMALAFSRSQADFSGINGHEPPSEDALFISSLFQKVFVDVNEEGTEAAAATALSLTMGPSEPLPVFRADRPFLFAIRDWKSGTILFLGRIADPSPEGGEQTGSERR